MKTKPIVCSVFLLASFGACTPEFKTRSEPCDPGEARDAEGKCQPAGVAGTGGQGGQGGGPSGGGGTAPNATPVLQVPPRRVGLRRARALDVTISLQQAVNVDLNVTVDGLPAYMSAEPLTLPAGATSGVLVMRATNEAPLGVPSQVRVRATGAMQPAEANLEAWVQGEPGTLDETFGEGGLVLGAPMTGVAGVAPLPDGSVVIVGSNDNGQVILRHLLIDGKGDPSFGDQNNQKSDVLYSPPASSKYVYSDEEQPIATAVQADGKIVTFGIRKQLEKSSPSAETQVKGYQWHISRHLPEGLLDVAFGSGGAISISDGVAPPVEPKAAELDTPLGSIAVATDGKIIVAARDSYDPASPRRVVRLTSEGRLDETFGDKGFVRAQKLLCRPSAVAASQDGSVVVGGNSTDTEGREQACLAKFLSDGSLDQTFGAQGTLMIPVPQRTAVLYERALDVVLDETSTFISGFTRGENSTDTIFLANLLPDASYDTSFGQGGRATKMPQSLVTHSGVRITGLLKPKQEQGIIVAQQVITDALFGGVSNLSLYVVKYDERGELDLSFGLDGSTQINTDQNSAYIFRKPYLAESSDGRIFLTGLQQGEQHIARLWP